jgi:streptomycin 6-kinase
MYLSNNIITNDFNKYIFPDEINVLTSVIEREFETENKELSKLANTLIESKPYLVEERLWLVHGDFHAGNLAETANGLKAFDPFGMKGTPASDPAKYIALSCRDERIKSTALLAENITECNRFDLGWLIAANILKRLHYLKIMGRPSTNEKGNIKLAYKAMEIW